LAVLDNGDIQIRRDAGKLSQLEAMVRETPIHGRIGIGHTRWATHGEPNARNAHPHIGSTGEFVVVHNGIVENYLALREELQAEGVEFKSETDTETIVHLVEKFYSAETSLEGAVRKTLGRLKGAHGIVVLSSREPDKIVAARVGNAGGVVIGLGEGENYVASDLPAILEHTRRAVFLETHQMAVITREDVTVTHIQGSPVPLKVQNIAWDPVAAEKGEYRHFMQKEIHEQVRSLTDTLAGRVDFEEGQVTLHELNLSAEKAKEIKKIIITACGTAAHAGMVGKILLERIARVPTEVAIASEFRYADPLVDEHTVVLAISQSGETADTLAAMEEGRTKGALLWSIVNAIGSQAMRIADGCIPMQVGPEIGVASTKAFTAQVTVLTMIAIHLAQYRKTQPEAEIARLIHELHDIPKKIAEILKQNDTIKEIAKIFTYAPNFLYLGRSFNFPVALEGALKLKEISYIHAEGYPAAEMKHGPIALIDQHMPVVVLATSDHTNEKMISNIEEVRARKGRIISVTTENNTSVAGLSEYTITIPETIDCLTPLLTVIPLQLLSYHIAINRKCDVDQPRNLAKSVTVE